ncbi:MAG TPA: DNA polymerase III subunit gamma/tau [Bacteroidia bacterium]|nr:DNA polymerase III subunit gamma/tau [Bacteroidia bacterium]
MDQFVVSARKYRPSTFKTVVGQSGITTTLKNAIKNKHLAQAFLFCGPRGVGKTTCARILAKTINCTNLTPDTEGCNQCESCISFNNGQSLNIYELDAASNNSVDDIRNLVEQVRYPPHSGQYKIYIIDEVHMLSSAAFNAFLKTLEEPPPYAIFILATTEKHKIIPTILSRCQIFDFSRITIDDIAAHLIWVAGQEQINAEHEALHLIAQKADGALRDALSIFDQIVSFAGNNITYKHVIENLNILDYEYYFRLTDYLLLHNYSDTLLLLDEIVAEGFEIHHFILGLGNHFRDLLVSKDPKTTQLLEVGPSTRDKYKSQATQCSAMQLFEWLHLANRCDIEFKIVQNQRLHLEIALLKMCVPATAPETSGNAAAQPARKHPPESEIPKKNTTEKTNTTATTPSTKVAATPASLTSEKVAPTIETTVPVAEKIAEDTSGVPAKETIAEPVKTSQRRNSTLSISGKLSDLKAPVTADEPATEINKGPRSKIAKDDLMKHWQVFVEKSKKEGRMQLAVSLSGNQPVLIDSELIEIPVINSIQAEEIFDAKQDLVQFLRKALNNNYLDIQTRIVEDAAGSETAYTPMEKFKKMAEKNPDLNELRQQFDLELDF